MPQQMYRIQDITEEVFEIMSDLPQQSLLASETLNGTKVPDPGEHACKDTERCPYLLEQEGLPEYHVGLIPRISKSNFWSLWHSGARAVQDLPEDFDLPDSQLIQAQILKDSRIDLNELRLRQWLDGLSWPLYFLDYETYAPVIPKAVGYKPYERMVFQFSCHRLDHKDATPEHSEFVVTESVSNLPLLPEQLQKHIGSQGDIIVWNEAFEKECNDLLGRKYPDCRKFFEEINARIKDLMLVFKDLVYVDYRFKGSYSLKNVLPVLVPDMTYDTLSIQNGQIASVLWNKIVIEHDHHYNSNQVLSDLRDYCRLDTLAMVRILAKLQNLGNT